MHAKPELVAKRRWKRRLKAAASVAVALAAAAFLACQKSKPEEDAGSGPRETEADGPADAKRGPSDDATPADAASAPEASAADARPDALAKHRGGPRDAAVDVREHRKGMPVPDNLLE